MCGVFIRMRGMWGRFWAADGYVQAGRYGALGKLKQAIFDAWAEKQKAGYWQRGFDDIVHGA